MTDNSDSQFGGLLSQALATTLAPKRAQGLWYEGKDLTLDGFEFIECRFDNCTLRVTNAQNVNLQKCFISNDTAFIYGQSAISAIRLFNLKFDEYYEKAPYWVPDRDEKGRITLTSNTLNDLASIFQNTNG